MLYKSTVFLIYFFYWCLIIVSQLKYIIMKNLLGRFYDYVSTLLFGGKNSIHY